MAPGEVEVAVVRRPARVRTECGCAALIDAALQGAAHLYAIFVSPRNVDMSKPVHVVMNGKRVFSESVETDLSFMLAQAAQDDDPALVYHARIDIVVPAPGDSAAHTRRVGSMRRWS
jgi:hypothetical protein